MDVEELFKKLKPVMGSRIDALWLDYQLNPESRKEIEGLLRALAVRHLGFALDQNDVLLVPPPDGRANGEYPLGRVIYGRKTRTAFGLRENEWIQHVAIFGRTGSGKTNVGMTVLKNFLAKNKPFLIFDWKRNYRDILEWPESKGVRVYTVGRDIVPFRFNPLTPPQGTLLTTWLKKLIEIMCHVYWLGEGVAYLLQKAIDQTYQSFGAYSLSPKRWPTLADVQEWLIAYKAKGREAQWMDSTLRVVGTLCFGEVGNVLNTGSPTPLQELLSSNVILELDALSNSDKTFLIETLLLWTHHFRMQEQSRERFKHAILIEEAHHVLLRRRESKESITDVIVREIRELGEALIIIDQHPSLISIPALGNTHCTIAMNLKHARDVAAIGEAMLLPDSERDCLGRIDVGTGIVKLQSRWTEPFLVKFPLVQISKGLVTDSRLRELSIGHSAVSPQILPQQESRGEVLVVQAEDKVEGEHGGIGDNKTRILVDVMTNPTSGIAARYKRLLLGVARGASLVGSLVDAKLLSSHPISTPKGRVRFLQVTDKGMGALRRAGFQVESRRTGGPEHEYWRHKVAEFLQAKGYVVELEKPLGGGRSVDMEARRGDETIAVEIETGKSDAQANLMKLIDTGYKDIWVVFTHGRPRLDIPPICFPNQVRMMTASEAAG